MISENRKGWYSFGAGEITPELFGRLDIPEYQTALALAQNWRVLPHGPVETRAGTQFVLATKSSGVARLVPFIRGNGDALMLEFGAGYIRFHKDGGTVLDPAAEQAIESIDLISMSDPPDHTFTITGHMYNDDDPLVVYGITRDGKTVASGGVYIVDDATTDTFTLRNASGQPIFWEDTDPLFNDTYDGGSVNDATAAPYEVVTPYAASELFEFTYEQAVDTLTISHDNWVSRELVRTTDSSWALTKITHATAVSAPSGTPTCTPTGTEGESLTYRYVVTAVDSNYEESVASSAGSAANDLSIAGQYNTITWSSVSGASYYNVYKEWATSSRYYFIGSAVSNSTGLVDDNIIPDFTKAPPEATDPFGTTDNLTTLPAVVSYFEQRRVFASTIGDPQRFWATQSGSYTNMNVSIVPQENDPFNLRLAARRAHTIRHIVPFADLLMLTGSALWRVFSDDGGALSGLNADSRIAVEIGSTFVRPATYQNVLMYPSSRGEHITSVRYSNESGGYTPQDLSVVAPHLITGYTWVDMAFQESPHPTLWCVRSDGVLVGATYLPAQNVIAWHRHVLGGTDVAVESVGVIPQNDGPEDVVYLIVRRTINGGTVRYIEFVHSRTFADIEHSFCADAGLMYDGAAITTVTGLDHLEGETVAVLADGVATTKVVSSGSITLSSSASVITVGLGYNCDLTSLPLAYQAQAQGMGQQENVSGVRLRVVDTAGLYAGPSFSDLEAFAIPLGESYGLRNGIAEAYPSFDWSEDSQVYIRQSAPLPALITAMSVDFGEGD